MAEGDRVVIRFSAQSMHQGEWMGIQPTGKRTTITGIVIYRIADGRIAARWFEEDVLGVLQRLGSRSTQRER